jgi:branched-chain amino acid transport system ATP-binding protein
MSLLQCTGLGKRFAGLQAVDSIDLSIEKGEIVGLIGPNGAGKTTFVNLLTGELPITSGSILYRGRDITRLASDKRNRLGLARTFQVPRPFHSMSILENVTLAAQFGREGRPHDRRSATRKAAEILDMTGLGAQAEAGTGTLTTAGLKRLEVARALATEPDILFLDEPLGGLNQGEAADALKLIRSLNEGGMTILFIEHIIKAVSAISHRIVVLARGQKLAEGTPEAVLADKEVQRAYLGNISSALERNTARRAQPGGSRPASAGSASDA